MGGQRGKIQFLMMSLFKKASAYDGLVTVNGTNWCGVKGHSDCQPKHDDEIITDLDEVSGSEFVTSQEIGQKAFSLSLTFPRVRPNILIGMMAGALGGLTPAQDGAATAYKHSGSPCASTATLPDFNLIYSRAGDQQIATGIVVNSWEIAGEEGKPLSLTVDLVGSGYRVANADSYIAAIAEARLFMRHLKSWRESGATISIDAAHTQWLENISSGTPTNISSRLKSFKVKYSNNIILEPGAGSGSAYNLGADFGTRTVDVEAVLRYLDTTERAAYEAQTAMAIEFDVKGDTKIDPAGTFYPGFDIVIPKFQFKKDPAAEGGLHDKLTVPYQCQVMDDGTNPIIKFTGYSAQAAYLAA